MGSKKPAETKVESLLSPEQRKLVELGIPTFERFVNNPPQVANRPVEGFNALQQQSQESAIGNIGDILSRFEQGQQGLQGGQNFFGAAANRAFGSPGTQSLSSFGDLANPYIDRATQATLKPITESLTNEVLPQIRQGAIGAGQFGGSRQGLAENSAVNQYVDRATQAIAPIQSQLYGQALAGDISGGLQTQRLQSGEQQGFLGAASQGLNALPQISALQSMLGTQAGLLPSQILGSVGDQQRNLSQEQQESAYQANLTNQFLPFTLAQQVLHGGSGLPGGSTNTTSQGGRPSLFSSALGAASSLLPFFL